MAAINTNGYTTADALDPNQNVVFDPMYNDLVPKATYDARRAGGTASPVVQDSPQNAVNPAQAQWNGQQGVDQAQQAQIGARSAVLPYQQTQINASRTANAAQGNVYNAQAATFPIQQAQIGAKGAVLDQQGIQNQMQQGFSGQEQQANTARIGDQNALVSARGNTADQTAVAMYNEQQAGNAGIYQSEGLGAPQRVVTSDNRGGPLAPGVIGDVRTQEQRVAQEAQDRENQRALQLKGAQLAVDLQATNVNAAEQAAARVGLRLDQANLMVSQASNAANQAKLGESNAALDVNQANLGVTQAGIGVDQANLNYNISKQAPTAGDVPVIDPVTGVQAGWGPPAQAANAQLQFNQNQGLANAGQTALYNNQRDIAGQTAVAGGRPLGQLSKGELIDLANTHPEYYFAVLQEFQQHYGVDANTANTLIQDALPKKKSGGFSEGDLNGGQPVAPASPTGAAAQNSYNGVAAAIAGITNPFGQ